MTSNKSVKSIGEVKAVLGPTNTGKTYTALQEMLKHSNGVIGFPLRLLARENYDRIVKEKGRSHVALVTGEEKIVPSRARYFICTVESMPVEKSFEFLSVDEIQLCADPERGHIFTDRLLCARGSRTTLFLGAEYISRILATLVPNLRIESRPRLSELTYTGFKKLTRLPKRAAIVAFSIDDIYQVGELVRRHKGGAALILGALSPRARNAQVDLYQKGEVDYLVATDAIGMGLNMDIHHVAFAGKRKFDGRKLRNLSHGEISQIAGRAGRYLKDGTFGTTLQLSGFNPDVVQAVENHQFEETKYIFWRNSDLDFSSQKSLLASLERTSGTPLLQKGREGDDLLSLRALLKREDVVARATNKIRLRLLWDVCQIPDFRKTLDISHQDFLARIYEELCQEPLKKEFVKARLAPLENMEGEVDALMTRISHVRTWTYIANRPDWLEDPQYWREYTRRLEDSLSDSLHQSLTRRFIDTRSAALLRSFGDNKGELMAGLRKNGEIVVEGHVIGYLKGFRFVPAEDLENDNKNLFLSAGRRILKPEIHKKLKMMSEKKGRFTVTDKAEIFWQEDETNPLPGEKIGHLGQGDDFYSPRIFIQKYEPLEEEEVKTMRDAAVVWFREHMRQILWPLLSFEEEPSLKGEASGIAFQLKEKMGVLPRSEVKELINTLDDDGRQALRAKQIRLGPQHVYARPVLKPAAVHLKAVLWSVYHTKSLPPKLPHDGAASVPVKELNYDPDYALCIGYPLIGPRLIRVDMLDRVVCAVYDHSSKGHFQARHEMAEWLGCGIEELYAVLEALGHQKISDQEQDQGNVQLENAQQGTKDEVSEPIEKKESVKETEVSKKDEETQQNKPDLAVFKLRQFSSGNKRKSPKSSLNQKSKRKSSKSKDQGDKGQKKPQKNRNREGEKQKTKPLSHSPFSVLADMKDQVKGGTKK